MANIAEYLKKILSSRYGRDVRQSIHDGINAINNEVVDYGTTASKKAAEAAASAQAAKQSEINSKSSETSAGNCANTASQRLNEVQIVANEVAQNKTTVESLKEATVTNANAANAAASTAKTYAEKAEKAVSDTVDKINEAVELNVPAVSIDFETGHLMYQGGRFNLKVNQDTGHLEWEVA